jgi:hypothetical protein
MVTFRDQATHDAWEASPERAAWIASGDALQTRVGVIAAAPPSVFLFGTVMLCVATMLKLSVPTSKRVLGFYLKPGGATPGNTLVVVGGFASLVTGVCLITGEVDAPALFDAVQAGNFWQWVVRPGGD